MHSLSSKDSAANIVRLAKVIEKEQPMLLQGIRALSVLNLPHAESGLHRIIQSWGLALPLELHLFNKGILFAPMVKPRAWLEYLLCRKPGILLAGFPKNHEALGQFLETFWRMYKFEDGDHKVYEVHQHRLSKCVPYFLFMDEGRGLRKAPIQCVALESAFSVDSFKILKEAAAARGMWDESVFLNHTKHTGAGSSLTSRLLLYVLPHTAYKKKKKQFWYDVLNAAVLDLRDLFETGITVDNDTWFPIFIGMKGDAPALAKAANLCRSFNHLGGPGGICHHCLAGQAGHPWEAMHPNASWMGTLYVQRPWKPSRPSCLLQIPYSDTAPEKSLRSDPMHLIKLGISRHFVASTIIALGDWGMFPDSDTSINTLLESAHQDFIHCCREEIKQTPHLKMFTRESFHWTRRSSYPFGGFLGFKIKLFCCMFGVRLKNCKSSSWGCVMYRS